MNRAFITGLGAIGATGKSVDEIWQQVLQGQSGIDKLSLKEMADWPDALGGEVKEYNAKALVPNRKLLKLIARQDVLGIKAAVEAIEDSGILDYRSSLTSDTHFNDRTGIYVGSPGNKFFQQYDFMPLLAKSKGAMQPFAQHLFEEVHPMWLLKILPNNVLAYVGIEYGFKGANQNITNHVISGMQAIIEGYQAVCHGLADRVVVVAYDYGFEPQAYKNYEQLGILSKRHLAPFDKEHDGTILAEGAAALVIESEDSVQKRQGKKLAEIIATAGNSDAQGIFSIDSEAVSYQKMIDKTLEKSKLDSSDLGLITAHANGNQQSDITESEAIHARCADVPVTGFKWSTGHTLSAAGLMDTVLTTKAIQEKTIPGIASFKELAKACAPIAVSHEKRTLKSTIAMVLSRGFGGLNASVLLKNA